MPISALIQHRPEEQHRGGVLAAANLLSFVGILGASGVFYFFKHFLHLGPAAIFLWSSVLTLAALAYVLWLLPDSLVRLLLWIAAHTIYRLDLKGQENIPARGGVLLTPNHASWVDAVLLIAATDRPIRFLMFKGVYDHPVVKPFAKMLKIIPIASDQGPREMIHSLREASEALRNGEVVCIFPEGEITRIGQMLPFRRGFERIVKGIDVPIIPVNIDGIWGSIFSFSGGRFLWKWPRTIPYPVRLTFGEALPSTATATDVRQAVQQLSVDAFQRRRRYMKPLTRSFHQGGAAVVRGNFAMADGHTPKLSFSDSLIKTVFLARRLRAIVARSKNGGDTAAAIDTGSLVNWAALLLGKVPINLNYTTSNEALASCARQCDLKTVVTSKAFLEKVPTAASRRDYLCRRFGAESPDYGKDCGAAGGETFPGADAGMVSGHETAGIIGRYGDGDFLERIYGRTEGRGAIALQSGFECGTDRAGFSFARWRPDSGDTSVLSFVRVHRHIVSAGADRYWRGVSCQPARCGSNRRAGKQIFGVDAAVDADIPEFVRAAMPAGSVWQPANRDGGSGKIAGANCAVV